MLDIEIIVFMSVIKTLSKAELGKAKYLSCLQECDLLFLSLFRIAVEKLHEMDDAFRKQLESMLAAHQEELLQLANEKEKQIQAANEKVMLILNLWLLYLHFSSTAATTVVLGSHVSVSIWLISGREQPCFST